MLERRTKIIVWSFLLGIIVIEGTALAMVFRARHGGWFSALAHYAATPMGNLAAWCLAALVTVVYCAYAARRSSTIGALMLHPERWRPYLAVRVVAIPMALISGLFEETFFRRVLMDVALAHGASIAAQIALSAVIFGAAHAIWAVFGGWRAALGAMIATTTLGFCLAVAYVVGGRALAPCIAAHIAINLLLEPWLIITAATNDWNRYGPRTTSS